MKTHPFFEQIRKVEVEYRVARVAVARYQFHVQANPRLLTEDAVVVADVLRCLERMERTFPVRMFSEFEAALRDVWARVRKTQPEMQVLIDRISDRWRVAPEVTGRVHEVRELRNAVVHSTTPPVEMALPECRGHVCSFLSYVPYTFLLRPRK